MGVCEKRGCDGVRIQGLNYFLTIAWLIFIGESESDKYILLMKRKKWDMIANEVML